MKRWPLVIVLTLLVLGMVIPSCGGSHRYDSRLARADSLMNDVPDSALAIVKGVTLDSLPPATPTSTAPSTTTATKKVNTRNSPAPTSTRVPSWKIWIIRTVPCSTTRLQKPLPTRRIMSTSARSIQELRICIDFIMLTYRFVLRNMNMLSIIIRRRMISNIR